MATTLVRGKYVICKVTGPTSAEVISDGAVFQRDGEIIAVGKYDSLRAQHPEDEVVGSRDHLVIPGLVNDHFHVGLSPFQMGAPDLPLELWTLFRNGHRDVDPYINHLYGAAQMIKSGTTTVQVIVSPNSLVALGRRILDVETAGKILKAYQKSGMRVTYATSIRNQNALVAGPAGGEEKFASQLPAALARRFRIFTAQLYVSTEEHISNVEEICMRYAGNHHERIRVTIAPSNVHRCSDDLLLAVKEQAVKYNVGIHIHLQETVYQKLYGLRTWGKTPLQHLYDLGFLGRNVTCGHSVWLTAEDIEVIAATDTNVCHLPSSNLRLQNGIAPVNRLLEKGIRVSLGTDEAGINDDKDMFQEMRLALILHRVPGIENTPPTAYQVLQMATVNGASCTGFGDHIGTLEPGKRADMVLMDLSNIEEAYLHPDISIVDALIQRGRCIDVDTVMIDGEVVLRDHQLTRIDYDVLIKELKNSLSRPLLPHEIERKELMRRLEPYLRHFYTGTMGKPLAPHYYYNACL